MGRKAHHPDFLGTYGRDRERIRKLELRYSKFGFGEWIDLGPFLDSAANWFDGSSGDEADRPFQGRTAPGGMIQFRGQIYYNPGGSSESWDDDHYVIPQFDGPEELAPAEAGVDIQPGYVQIRVPTSNDSITGRRVISQVFLVEYNGSGIALNIGRGYSILDVDFGGPDVQTQNESFSYMPPNNTVFTWDGISYSRYTEDEA